MDRKAYIVQVGQDREIGLLLEDRMIWIFLSGHPLAEFKKENDGKISKTSLVNVVDILLARYLSNRLIIRSFLYRYFELFANPSEQENVIIQEGLSCIEFQDK